VDGNFEIDGVTFEGMRGEYTVLGSVTCYEVVDGGAFRLGGIVTETQDSKGREVESPLSGADVTVSAYDSDYNGVADRATDLTFGWEPGSAAHHCENGTVVAFSPEPIRGGEIKIEF